MTDEKPGLSEAQESATTSAAPKRRSRDFGKALLSKLPQLAVSKWEASDTLDVYQDMQGIVEVDADAFLQPLEPLAEDHHDRR